MKRRLFGFGVLLFFATMLLFPKIVFTGASEGLLLWFQIVLPTLLPFIIIANLLIHTSALAYAARFLGPILEKIFKISPKGSIAVLTGFLCGYPMGAKTTGDLLREGYISKREGAYLLSFCNNTSPMFLISYVLWQNLGREELLLPSLTILLLAPVASSFLFRRYHLRSSCTVSETVSSKIPAAKGGFQLLDNCIMNGFETITKVGGYIILFSIILTLVKCLPIHHPVWNLFFLPSLEITNGIPLVLKGTTVFAYQYTLVMGLTAFGGFCSIAQTKCMIQNTGLSILPYIIEKLITASVTSLLAFGYCKFIM